MTKRRGHGEGSVYLRKDGRWAAYISLDDGGRKCFYGKTQKEVIEKLQMAQREKHSGTLVTGPDQLFKVYLAHWLEIYKPTVRIATYYTRRSAINSRIIPALGQIPLRKITPQDIRTFYASEMKAGLKSQTVRNYHIIIRRVLDQAVKDGLVAKNVCSLVDPPKLVKKEMQTLNQEQAHRLLVAVKGHRLEALLTLALATGMRQGELLGLRWTDINLDKGNLSVRRTIKRVGTYGIIVTEPKTAKGKRKISLPDFVVLSLREHQVKQQALQQKAGDKWHNNGLVICNHFGNMIESNNLNAEFKKVLRDANLPDIRFHDLRHSAATLFFAMGVHPKIVQEILGHSSIAITLDIYSHVLPSMHEDAMSKMNNMLGEK